MTVQGIVLALVAAVLANAQPSGAQDWRGHHWERGKPIRVWIDPEQMPPNGEALVEMAMKTWTNAAAGRFTLVKVWESTAPVRLHFMSADYRYGVTAPRTDPATGFIVKAEVAVAADVGRDPLERQLIVYLTALHEIGHALGLEHTDDITNIMYLFREPGDGEKFFGAYRKKLKTAADIGSPDASGLSPADVTALKALYDR